MSNWHQKLKVLIVLFVPWFQAQNDLPKITNFEISIRILFLELYTFFSDVNIFIISFK